MSSDESTRMNKRQRLDDSASSPKICTSPVIPVSPGDLEQQDEVIFAMLKERKRIEDKLLSVEFLDEAGEAIWTCRNLCESGRHKKLTDDELPYPNQDDYWYPRSVWTLPAGKKGNNEESRLVLTQPNQVRQVRIGLHRWKARVGEDIVLDCYDPKTQSMGMRIPIVMETHARHNAADMMGSEALYLVGRCTVTSPQILHCLAGKPEAYDSGWHSAHEQIHSFNPLKRSTLYFQ